MAHAIGPGDDFTRHRRTSLNRTSTAWPAPTDPQPIFTRHRLVRLRLQSAKWPARLDPETIFLELLHLSEEGRIASCMRYLATVRRAMWMPLSLSRSTISESVSGLPSFSMTSFMMSFTLRLGVKKCA